MDEDLRDPEDSTQESNVYMWLLKYKGALYAAELVETTPDSFFFQVDASFVRKGLFPKNRLDMRHFGEMGIVLIPVHHAPIQEQ